MTKDKNEESQSTSSADEVLSLNLKDRGPEDYNVGTVFVDPEYRIKPFVSTIAELMQLNSFSTDYELKDFTRHFHDDGIKDEIQYVINNQEKTKKEVAVADDDKYFMMEMRPYKAKRGVEGVVISFVDITEIKEAKDSLAEKVEKIKKLQRQIIKNDVSERWRIGHYLHDDLGQSLVSAKFLLESLKEKVMKGEKELAEDLDQLIDIIDNSMENARDLSHEIVPVDIEEKGISQAFNNFAVQLEKNHDINCELEYDGKTMEKLENVEVATHLYRIIHESAKNAAVHGEAENVKVTLHSDDQYLYLSIADDGMGFSNDPKGKSGMGINLIGHRMELIGGTLEVKNTSEIGNTGVTVSCRVPVEKIKQESKGI